MLSKSRKFTAVGVFRRSGKDLPANSREPTKILKHADDATRARSGSTCFCPRTFRCFAVGTRQTTQSPPTRSGFLAWERCPGLDWPNGHD